MEHTLEIILAWLGLSQYYERFLQAGFESWETLLEITENDLEVKLSNMHDCVLKSTHLLITYKTLFRFGEIPTY